jgi:hypothetical protein
MAVVVAMDADSVLACVGWLGGLMVMYERWRKPGNLDPCCGACSRRDRRVELAAATAK